MPNANVNPMDINIATMVDKDLKSCASKTALSACECTSSELRQEFARISQEAIRRQERLSSLMSQKGIYVAPQADDATVGMLMPQLQAAARGLEGGIAMGGAQGTAQATRTL